MNFKTYRVDFGSECEPIIVQAPNEGSAIEFAAACLGMLYWNEIPSVVETTETPDEDKEFYLKIMKDAKPDFLQGQHVWKEKP